MNTGNVAEGRHRDFVNRRCHELMEDLRRKRAVKKKERRGFSLSRHNNVVARLPQRNAVRHRDSRKAERENR